MINSTLEHRFDLRSIGKHNPRERYQRGSLTKVDKRTKKWLGLWHVYVRQPDGSEKRLPRTRILGPATMSKADAQRTLDELIAASGSVQRLTDGLTRDSKFEDVWKRYHNLKQGAWGRAAEKAILSIFEGGSQKKKQPSVLSVFGQLLVCDVTRDPLQNFLNGLAISGASYSVLKKRADVLGSDFPVRGR